MTRTYQLKRRAHQQDETRQRIVEAAVHLHETLGPARTSITAIAEQAGVERLTVYRHFPDEQTLFTACTSHYLAANPLPEPADWMQIADPETRLVVALTEIYAYYQRTERMQLTSARDLRCALYWLMRLTSEPGMLSCGSSAFPRTRSSRSWSSSFAVSSVRVRESEGVRE